LMLASTVQFSRYGRPRSKTLPHPRQGATVQEKTRPKPVPSGPNSVLDQAPAAAAVPPLPKKRRTRRRCRRAGQLTSAPQ
jgi:hypothetical protein